MTRDEEAKCAICNGTGERRFEDDPGAVPCYPCFGTGRDLSRWGTQIERHRSMLALLIHLNVPVGVVGRSGISPFDLAEWAQRAREHLGEEFAEKLLWKQGADERDVAGFVRWLREHADKLEARERTRREER